MGEPRPSSPIMVVDDDASCRGAMAQALQRAGYVTRELESGEELLAAVEDETPALVLLDVCLPGISGYQVCHDLRREFGSRLPIVFVSGARTESYDRVAGYLVGGDDYLGKPVAADELLLFLVGRLLRGSASIELSGTGRLTRRELEILQLLANGANTREIAGKLVISTKTVNTHIDRILAKLGVHSRAELVATAYRRSLVNVEA